MECNNLAKIFTEFKKFREEKKNAANEENFYCYVNSGLSIVESDSLGKTVGFFLKLLGEEQRELSLLVPIDLERSFWRDIYLAKIEKVLKDIWVTGEMKDTYGLDLNWPADQQSQERQEVDDNPIESPRPRQSEQNLAKRDKEAQELKEKNTQLEKEKKIYWIISGLIFLALVWLVVWLVLRKKVKK